MAKGKSKAEDDNQSARLPVHASQQKARPKPARRDLHKTVFDGLPEGTELQYRAGGKIFKGGSKIKEGGILCCCCQKEFVPSQFEAHVGYGHRKNPYMNIVNSEGVSLHKLSVQLLQGKTLAEENNESCFICDERTEEGFIICHKCHKRFHTDCILLRHKPAGTWKCTYCLKTPVHKTKQTTDESTTESSGKADIGTCFLCSGDDYDISDEFSSQTIILCSQCGKEYHVGCLKNKGIADLKELPKDEWFCDETCCRVYQTLKEMVVKGKQKLPDPALNRIKKKGFNNSGEPDIGWRLLRGKMASKETRELFGEAISIFHDAFELMAGQNSCDLFPSMVYGRTVDEGDFEGMYCALLIVDKKIVSVAMLRVYGEDVAEIPYVATKEECKGQGYFTALFSCIENLIASLPVKDIVVPVTDESASYWENKLCFEPTIEDKLKDYKRKYFNLIEFKETPMLHKSVRQSLNCEKPVDG